jgi:hypothetical protein
MTSSVKGTNPCPNSVLGDCCSATAVVPVFDGSAVTTSAALLLTTSMIARVTKPACEAALFLLSASHWCQPLHVTFM